MSNKRVRLLVEIDFSDSIYDDDEIKEVAENVATAIKNEAAGQGIAPEDSEAFTENITISQSGLVLVNRRAY